MATAQDPLCRAARDEDVGETLATVDPLNWLEGSVAGRRLLCLAAGGGRQSVIYAAAGADVTVVDLSRSMLELDRTVALERGLAMRILEGSMDDLSMFQAAEFDVVIHPVSSCYLDSVTRIYGQVARVLRPGGIYISQHKQPVSLQASLEPVGDGTYSIQEHYYRNRTSANEPLPPVRRDSVAARRLREPNAIEFLHRWEELIGGLCRAGFVIEDLVEPDHARTDARRGTFAGRANYIAPYVRIKARRRSATSNHSSPTQLWLPP